MIESTTVAAAGEVVTVVVTEGPMQYRPRPPVPQHQTTTLTMIGPTTKTVKNDIESQMASLIFAVKIKIKILHLNECIIMVKLVGCESIPTSHLFIQK